jgi:TonB family protein
MLELKPSSRADKSTDAAACMTRQHRRMLLAIVLLVAALAVVVAKDRRFWFSSDDSNVDDEVATAATPIYLPEPDSKTAAEKTRSHSLVTTSAPEAVEPPPAVVENHRVAVAPLNVQLISGDTKRVLPAGGSNTLQVEIPANCGEWRIWPAPQSSKGSGATVYAAERVPLPPAAGNSDHAAGVAATPLLTKQMRVRGSVILQALVSADGIIERVQVLSGPTALAPAAREAIRQWRFKPYLKDGQPVETQANITVNFVISTS